VKEVELVQRFKGSRVQKVESIWLKETIQLSLSIKARWTTPGQGRLEGWKVGWLEGAGFKGRVDNICFTMGTGLVFFYLTFSSLYLSYY